MPKNPSQPIFSVVIPAFNEEKFIAKTLESVLEQDFKNFELIVVEGNSNPLAKKLSFKKWI